MKSGRENILVVDDNHENLRLLTHLLTDYGYNIRPVTNGKLALSAARAIVPDLILLDINMPEMDGYEVCNQLKSYEVTQYVPVIFLSALNETINKVKAFGMGGVDYITKPFQIDEVLARIKTHLTIRHLQEKLIQSNTELKQKIDKEIQLKRDLEAALEEVKIISGLLPICSYCKKIRDDEGYWHQIETYISKHSDTVFSHGICKTCYNKHHPDLGAYPK